MLASSFLDPVLGLDVHFEMVPTPAPVPTPIPNPFIGLVFDPIGLAAGIALGAMVGAVLGAPFQGPVLYWTAFPATNTGTEAKHVPGHILIPPGVAWAPFPKTPKPVIRPGETPAPALPIKPENDAVMIVGSKTVTVMGSNAVRLGDIALSCSEPLRLPSSVVLAVPKGAPILIGGPPSLDIVAALTASLRTRFVSDSLHALLSRLKPSRFRNFLHRAVCFFTGHPVDVASGKVITEFVDAQLPGPLPLRIERLYSSAFASRRGPLGHGWSISLDQSIWRERGKVVLLAEDGREIEFDTFDFPGHRIGAGEQVHHPIERLTLHCHPDECWTVVDRRGLTRVFGPVEGRSDGRAMLRQIQSRGGAHEISFFYGLDGRLQALRDACGRRIELRHDARGRLTELLLPNPTGDGLVRHRQYLHDDAGDCVGVIDSLGQRWSFEYSTHLLVRETDRNGHAFHFDYDGVGEDAWCTRTWGDGGLFDHQIGYDKQNRATFVRNSTGQLTRYHMNAIGQVVEVIDALGASTRHVYDPVTLQRVKQIDALGHASWLDHDGVGNTVAKHGPDGTIERSVFDAHNQIIESHDALGGISHYAYDRLGHLVTRVNPLGDVHRYEYTDGQLTRVELPGGAVTTLGHDRQKNIAWVQTNSGGLYHLQHDARGRLVRITNPRGGIEERHFDAEGRLVFVSTPAGERIWRQYDAEGNLLQISDGSRTAEMRYGIGNCLTQRSEAGSVVQFEYDTEARLIALVNELGERHTTELDENGQPKHVTTFDGRRVSMTRDPLRRVTRIAHAGGATSTITHDAASRPTRVEHGDGSFEAYAYRADGALLRAATEDATVEFERDALGRVLSERVDEDWVVSRWGASGRSEVHTSGAMHMGIERDRSGRARALTSDGVAAWAIRFESDEDGLATGARHANGLTSSWTRDAAGRPLRHEVRMPGRWLLERRYTWARGAQLGSLIDNGEGQTRWAHDERGRVVSATYADGRVLARCLDAAGNVQLDLDDERAPGGRLRRSGRLAYRHDDDGRLIEKCDGGALTRYHWSAAGRLRRVDLPDGLHVTFRYDAFGRRLTKQVMRGDDEVDRTEWTWDGDVPVHERRRGQAPITWIHEPESHTPLARFQAGDRHVIVSDHVGTPTELVGEGGELAWRARLDLFGRTREEQGVVDCPLRWPGQYHDAETGLHYNRWRYFDPATSSYLQPDPLGPRGGPTAYAYQFDPVTSADPLGLGEQGCGLNKGDPLPDDALVHRIGGGGADNLVPKPPELRLDPPGISSTRAASAADAAALGRELIPTKMTRLRDQLGTMGSATAAQIRAAGFDVIHDPTALWGNAHARIIHPDGAAGWTPQNIEKLAAVFTNFTGL